VPPLSWGYGRRSLPFNFLANGSETPRRLARYRFRSISGPAARESAPSEIDPIGIDPIGIDPIGIDPIGIDPIGIDPIGIGASNCAEDDVHPTQG